MDNCKFPAKDRKNSQNLNNDNFFRPPVTSDHCHIETEKYPETAILFISDDGDDPQGYGQLKEAFGVLTKHDVLQPYIYQILILDHLLIIMDLVIIYTFSKYDIRKTSNPVKSRV